MKDSHDRSIIFITGTDTGIGKTIVSLLLMQLYYEKGYDPFYIKPFQTGCANPYDSDSDAAFIYRNVDALRDMDPADSVIFCHRNPKAPFFAGRDQDEEINLKKAVEFIDEKSKKNSPLIVEGAGGLHVPIDRENMIIDFIGDLGARPLLAARAGLGTINHTLLSIDSLRSRGLEPAGLVFINPGPEPVPDEMVMENMEAISAFSGIEVSGVIGMIEDFSSPGEECYGPLKRVFPELG